MASTIKVKRSAVSGNAPNTSNISTGELALNTADGILYSSDGSNVFEVGANLTSLSVTGTSTFSANTLYSDNVKAIFGTGSDLEIYHDGSNSYIQDKGTGDLFIDGDNNLTIRTGDGLATKAKFTTIGAVELYYNNSKKIETTNIGISVTGSATIGSSYGGTPNVAADDLIVQGTGDSGITIGSGSSSIGRLMFADTASDNVGRVQYNHSTDAMQLYSGGSATLTLDSSNRVGIGTTSPSGKLEVAGDAIFTETAASVQNDSLQIGFTAPNGFIKSKNSSGSPASNLDLYSTDTGGNTNLGIRLQYTGNVGIGTDSPSYTLHTVGTASIQSGVIALTVGADDAATTLTNSTRKRARIGAPHYLTAEEPVGIIMMDAQAAANELSIGGGTGSFNAATKIGFYTAATYNTTTGTERMRIDSSGRLLIATTTASGSQVDIVDATGNNNRALTISRSVTDAAAKSSAISIRSWSNSEEPITLIGAGIDDNTNNIVRIGGGFSNLNSATTVAFYTASNNTTTTGTTRMVINSSGNVGIGTTSPSYLFHAVGSSTTIGAFRNSGAAIGQLIVGNTQGDLVLRVTAAGDSWISSDTSKNLIFATSATERMRLDTNGDLNLGANPTNQYGYKLNIQDSSILYAQTASSGGTELKLFLDHGNTVANFGTVSTSHLALVTANSERMRIDSSGHVLIAKTSADGTQVGVQLLSDGRTGITSTSDYQLWLNRKTTDGDMIIFNKDATEVGAIQSNSGGLVITSGSSGTAALTIDTNQVATFSANVAFTEDISANGSFGTSGQALKTDGAGKVYWGDAGGGTSVSRVDYIYTSTEGQTVFTGADDDGDTLDLVVSTFDVFLNGSLITQDGNYTSNTTAVTFTDSLANNDIVVVRAINSVAGIVRTIYAFTANESQTTFSGLDDNSETLTIVSPHTDVFVNGVRILNDSANYSSNTTAVTFTSGLANNDIVTIVHNDLTSAYTSIDDDYAGGTSIKIDTSGNVGIGTTSPSTKLEVAGDITVASQSFVGYDTYSSTSFGSGGYARINSAASVVVNIDSNNNSTDASFSVNKDATGNTAGGLFYVSENGNVGIGTTSPGFTLDTSGTIRSTSITGVPGSGSGVELRYVSGVGSLLAYDRTNTQYLPLRLEGSSISLREAATDVLTVDGGKVGIGTGSPSNPLSVVGSSGTIGSFTNNSDADLLINCNSAVTTLTPTTGTLAFGTSSTERMRINSAGDICMGNTVANVSSNYSNQAGAGWYETGERFEIATTTNTPALDIGRNLASDGSIIQFRKQNTVIGNIGSINGSLYIHSPQGTDAGLQFGNSIVGPADTGGANRDATISLGWSSNRFKDLSLSGTAYIGEAAIETATGSTTSTTQTAISSFAKATYTSGKFIIQVTDSTATEMMVTELLVVHDGTTASATQYGTIYTGSAALATFDVDISGTDVRILATAASTNSMAYKVTETLIKV